MSRLNGCTALVTGAGSNNRASFDVASDGNHMVGLFALEESKPDETHLRVLLNVGDELRRRAAAERAK